MDDDDKELLAGGWTPIFDVLIKDFGLSLIEAGTFGLIWRLSNRRHRKCYAAVGTLAKFLGLHRTTVMKAIRRLQDKGLILDLTPERSCAPHCYVPLPLFLGRSVAESDTTVSLDKHG